ncbi:MAG TPA: prolyl oligopeptidase family serine peptidase, partial [Gemmatimonadales bacterium]
VWSADGQSILVAANARPQYILEPRDTDIFAFDATTGAARRLTDRRGPDDDPAVSPDGRLVAYTGYDDRKLGYQVVRLYVMNADGTSRRELLPDFGRDVTAPQWTADGTGLVFQSESEGMLRLFQVSLRGGAPVRLADSVGSGSSAYTGGSFSLSRTGRIAYTWATATRAGDVAVDGLGSAPTQVVTALNDDVLAQRQAGAVEEIWYPSSKDGRRIQGWIIKPPGFDPAKKYPLLLEIHGGPFAAYGPKFDIEKQVWAGAGYVVLYTNPRGSTSYGEEFASLIHHAYPGDDRFDLESGVDAVVARGYIDPSQLYVTGGSGGGVLTGWLIGHTGRYRAAVAQYPVVNWYSFALTTDIPYTTQYWFPGFPWEHQDQYLARSIISKVGAVTTPTMVITGESDWRTPMSESEQYFQALMLKGVPSTLIRVPGEFHGIRGRPSHFMQKIGYIQAWFDRYKKPAA